MRAQADDIAAVLATARPGSRWPWLIGGVLALALAAGGGFWWLQRQRDAAAVSYVTAPASRGPLTVTVTATGTVQPTTQVEVSSELSGKLASVEVDYNDAVTVGQVLARLDSTKLQAMLASSEASLAGAQARIAQAEASLTEAEMLYDSARELDRRGAATRQGFVSAQAARDRARAALAGAVADRSLAEATLSLQRADLAKAVIRSPINGIVLDRTADAGQIVAAALSAPVLFTLAEDLAQMELRVDIDEADIGRVKPGNTASFTVDAYGDRSFPAEITQVRYAPETTDGVVSYKAVLRVDNAALLLRPGMTATATITTAHLDDALQVPNAALRYAPPKVADPTSASKGGGLLGLIMPDRPAAIATGTARSVWVLQAGVPVEVPVSPGESDGQHTEILSGDLQDGQPVILEQSGTP